METHFSEFLYNDPVHVKTSLGTKIIKQKANIPYPPEFNLDDTMNVISFNFHEYFDGVIGLEDLVKTRAHINFAENILASNTFQLPIFYRTPETRLTTHSLEPHQGKLIKIPIEQNFIDDTEVIIDEHQFKDKKVIIPNAISKIKNGQCLVEIQNFEDTSQIIEFSEPFSAEPVSNYFVQQNQLVETPTETNNQPSTIPLESLNSLIRTSHLDSQEKTLLFETLAKFPSIIHQDGDKLTFTSKVSHEIKTTDEKPVYKKSYRYPYIHKQEVQRQISQMLSDGIIRPSHSPYSSPIWVVPKKQDASGLQKWRLVIDYRDLNSKTIDDKYPLPNITDLLDKLGNAKYFSVLDLASGFHQIEVEQDSISKTAFSVENGHYEYCRMPFGLKNAPSTFQRCMDDVLRDLQNQICLVYMDDIIIFSSTLEEHIKNLSLVLKCLSDHHFKIQLDKCEFLAKTVEFLGHIVTPDGIKPNKKKIQAILNFPIPKTQKEIRSFLGLLGFYRRFIENFANLTKPLTSCLRKKEKVVHTPEFIKSFESCKKLLTNDPILQYPDFKQSFEVTTDASNFALGAVLSQNSKPICYASRTLNRHEVNYSTIEKELLAIVWSVQNFRPYLFGRRFTIYTDHRPLQWLFNCKDPSSKLVRWKLKLSEYDYDIKYKPGTINKVADALSRIKIEDINTFEDNQSMFANPPDDLDDINIDDLLNETSTPDPQILDELAENLPDNQTVHSAEEEPTFAIAITEKPVNNYKNQLRIDENSNIKMNVSSFQLLFNKHRVNEITLKPTNSDEETFRFIKPFINLNELNCFYFKNSHIEKKIINILKSSFSSKLTKNMIVSHQKLEDVVDTKEQRKIIHYHHQGKQVHRGFNQTIASIRRLYFWPLLDNDVKNFINECVPCQSAKYERNPVKIKYQLTPTPSKPLQKLHIDIYFIDNCKFLTLIDPFSKLGQAIKIETKNTLDIINAFLKFTSCFNIPKEIVCDNEQAFNSQLFKEFCKIHHINLHLVTPMHSTSNSPIERLHSTLTESYRALSLEKPREKDVEYKMLLCVLGYNNTIHSTTKKTPFEILYGPNIAPFDISDEQLINNYCEQHKDYVNTINTRIRDEIEKQKDKTITKANEKREEPMDIQPDTDIYVKNPGYSKARPMFSQRRVISQDSPLHVTTNKGRVHKQQIKRKRKTYPKSPTDEIIIRKAKENEITPPNSPPQPFPCLVEHPIITKQKPDQKFRHARTLEINSNKNEPAQLNPQCFDNRYITSKPSVSDVPSTTVRRYPTRNLPPPSRRHKSTLTTNTSQSQD